MNGIHLIHKKDPNLPPIRPVEPRSSTYETGYWKIEKEKAKNLIGKNIYLHRAQSKPSYFGGVIRSVKEMNDGPFVGRILFTFDAMESHKNAGSPNRGWGMEMGFDE